MHSDAVEPAAGGQLIEHFGQSWSRHRVERRPSFRGADASADDLTEHFPDPLCLIR